MGLTVGQENLPKPTPQTHGTEQPWAPHPCVHVSVQAWIQHSSPGIQALLHTAHHNHPSGKDFSSLQSNVFLILPFTNPGKCSHPHHIPRKSLSLLAVLLSQLCTPHRR